MSERQLLPHVLASALSWVFSSLHTSIALAGFVLAIDWLGTLAERFLVWRPPAVALQPHNRSIAIAQ